MSKDFDELIRDLDLIIENVDSFKAMAPRAPEPPAAPPAVHHYDSFCENVALKVVLKVLLSSVDKIVKVQIANRVEQEIAQIEQQVIHAGGGPVSPEDLAQMTQYVRRTVNNLLE
ncbi:hypothetical protein BSQ97_11045 [Serratia proteamaculans]|nr:hypothetical protein BSQ97_11045 [Serratia proteamaculans]RYM56510.1 hypothetical protein BSQ96_07435 [Serratia proteamaculans]